MDWYAFDNENVTVLELDILNKASCFKVCEGADTVIHLAADPSPSASYESVKRINMDGTYNMMSAAHEQGCRRFIFASSIHAVKGYPRDEQVKTESPVRPFDLYGVSKAFGEALGSYYAYQTDMEVIAVRIGGFRSLDNMKKEGKQPVDYQRTSYISKRDLIQLIDRCVKAKLSRPFEIVHGVSDNAFKYLDLSDTRVKLQYQPQDDGFDV
ncbi:MAG: NAD(P)-dependent oxidoreductase [Alkalibacterium sp.]|nr:NAD(P)-dependent oxidoreductase [Alkalibacterium sp.]